MSEFAEYLKLLLQQFAGGPGPVENNLVRFILPALFWAGLFLVAWKRQQGHARPRERLLLWGFGLGFAREVFMFSLVSARILQMPMPDAEGMGPMSVEHLLAMISIVVVAAAFLRYVLDDAALAHRYLQIGVIVAGVCIASALLLQQQEPPPTALPFVHRSPIAQVFHIGMSLMIIIAILLLWRAHGWLRNTLILAFSFLLVSDGLALTNFASGAAWTTWLCPLGNAAHILAIPLLGFIYLREQSLEKRDAEAALSTYRDHLETLVTERTSELSAANRQLAQLAQQQRLILESAGEGICAIDSQGNFKLVNPVAAELLGSPADVLVGKPSHNVWHNGVLDGAQNDSHNGARNGAALANPSTADVQPLSATYLEGKTIRNEDTVFWRCNGEPFPVRFVSEPVVEEGRLVGAVVVFRDITERKRAEGEALRLGQEAAAMEERQRIAAEMHDGLAQTLSYIGLMASRSREVLEAGRLDETESNLNRIQDAAHRAGDDVRLSISALQESPSRPCSLQHALRDALDFSHCDGSSVTTLNLGIDRPIILPHKTTEQILRVVQEAVLNACRHAHAQNIAVNLSRHDHGYRLDIVDDGRGFEPDAVTNGTPHYGLRIMAARAAQINAELEVASTIGQGTCVRLTWGEEASRPRSETTRAQGSAGNFPEVFSSNGRNCAKGVTEVRENMA